MGTSNVVKFSKFPTITKRILVQRKQIGCVLPGCVLPGCVLPTSSVVPWISWYLQLWERNVLYHAKATLIPSKALSDAVRISKRIVAVVTCLAVKKVVLFKRNVVNFGQKAVSASFQQHCRIRMVV